MSVEFITVVGLTQTSYASVDEADDYHAKRLFASTWTASSTADKQVALMWATRLLDEHVEWEGVPATTDEQALQWPRDGAYDLMGEEFDDETIPQFLKDATSEFARCLITEELTKDNKVINQDLKSMKAGPVEFSFGYPKKKVLPDSVWNMVRPWGKLRYQASGSVALQRS